MEIATECPVKAYAELLGTREPERITTQVVGSLESSRKFRPISQCLLGSWDVNTGCGRGTELGHPERRVGGLGHQGPAVTKWGQTEGRLGLTRKWYPLYAFLPMNPNCPPGHAVKRELRFIKWLLCTRTGYVLRKHHFILTFIISSASSAVFLDEKSKVSQHTKVIKLASGRSCILIRVCPPAKFSQRLWTVQLPQNPQSLENTKCFQSNVLNLITLRYEWFMEPTSP